MAKRRTRERGCGRQDTFFQQELIILPRGELQHKLPFEETCQETCSHILRPPVVVSSSTLNETIKTNNEIDHTKMGKAYNKKRMEEDVPLMLLEDLEID